jgi:hypothetical protein
MFDPAKDLACSACQVMRASDVRRAAERVANLCGRVESVLDGGVNGQEALG